MTPSAINSWIGEEIRPTGLLVDYRRQVDPERSLLAGVSIFGGMDSSGALLAWRGWSMASRVSVRNQVLPLTNLQSLQDSGVFAAQRNDGTRPVGSDLDGKPGWAGWIGTRSETGFNFTMTALDTRGDRDLHHGEYAWETQFLVVGGDLPLGSHWTLVGEWMTGSSGMQPGDRPRAQLDFDAWYLLAHATRGRFSATVRRDQFTTKDRDGFPRNRDQRSNRHCLDCRTFYRTPRIPGTTRMAQGGLSMDSGVRSDVTSNQRRKNPVTGGALLLVAKGGSPCRTFRVATLSKSQ